MRDHEEEIYCRGIFCYLYVETQLAINMDAIEKFYSSIHWFFFLFIGCLIHSTIHSFRTESACVQLSLIPTCQLRLNLFNHFFVYEFIYWLTDWFIEWQRDKQIDRQTDRQTLSQISVCLFMPLFMYVGIDCLTDWLIDWLVITSRHSPRIWMLRHYPTTITKIINWRKNWEEINSLCTKRKSLFERESY